MNPKRIPLATLSCIAIVLTTSERAFADEFAPHRYGVGAILVQPEDSTYIEIRQVVPNGPAARAGLEVGDRILELDGQSVKDWSFDQVLDYLIRSEPLPLRITVRRDRDTITVELVRMLFSEIEAGHGYRIDSTETGYRRVPLHARPEANVGDVVSLDSLFTSACESTALSVSGKTTVVYFWTTWCGPCKELIKDVRDVTSLHRLIAVNLDSKCDDFRSALDKVDPPGEDAWAAGWYGPLSQTLGVYRRGVPTAALLDSEGRLVQVATGKDAILEMIRSQPTK